jgi:oxygen-independent coproporphyrinogen-3 oxidase
LQLLSLQKVAYNTYVTLSIYVHIPYCIKRCGYCDFNTYTPSELQDGATLEIVSADYIDAVVQELKSAPKDPVSTIFFGGGTPSLLPARDLGRVIAAIREHNGLCEGAEITLEANPDSVTPEKLADYISVGFNRISFGAQSFVPHVLATLDRTHNPDNVKKAVDEYASSDGCTINQIGRVWIKNISK